MIDDFTDDEVRRVLGATGDTPAREFRIELRDLLTDEAASAGRVAVVRPIETASSTSRRWWMPATAAAAVVALIGGFFLLGGRDDDTTVPATAPDGEVTPTTLDFAATMQGLVGRRLIETDSAFNPLPTLTLTGFTPSGSDGGTLLVDGHDGCNEYAGQLTVTNGAFVDAQLGMSLAGCTPEPFMPHGGDQIAVLTDGLDVTRDGTVHRFVALDSIPPIATLADVTGSWAYDGTFVMTLFADIGSTDPDTTEIKIGTCDLLWQITEPGRIVVVANAGQDVAACRSADPLPDALWTGLTFGVHEAYRFGDALLIATGDQVFRLERDTTAPVDPETSPSGRPGSLPDDLFDRTWVAVPSSPRPSWLRFDSLSSVQGAVGFRNFDGCNVASGTMELTGGILTVGEVGTTFALCQDVTPTTRITDGTTLSVELDQPRDILTVTTGAESMRYVALESFGPITGASDIVGDWSFDGEHVMTLFADGESMEPGTTEIKIGSCDAGWQIESGKRLVVDVEDGPTPCRVDPSTIDPLVQGLAVGNNEVYRFGPDTLIVVIAGRDVYLLDATVEPSVTSTGDPELDAFLESVAGSTWVLLPSAEEDAFQIDRPYLTIGDHRTGAASIDGYSGCTTVTSESPWQHGPDGFTVAIAARACRGQIPLDLVDYNIVDDRLVVTGPDGQSVVLERLGDLADATSIEGRWQTSDVPGSELVIDLKDLRLRLDGCTASFSVGTQAGSLRTNGWESNADDCRGDELSLSRALIEATITAHVTPTGDHLILRARSAKHRPIVFVLPSLGPIVDPTTISFEAGSAFGYRERDVVPADEALAHVSSLLGPPTHDTGWFDTTPDPTITDHEDCMGNHTQRTLWWHDFSISFFRTRTSDTETEDLVWTWTVGDTRITRNGDRREPYLPDLSDRSGLTSDSDLPIGIGSTTDDLIDAYGNQARPLNTPPDLFDDGAVFWSVGNTGFQVLVRDDIVIGFGAQIWFC